MLYVCRYMPNTSLQTFCKSLHIARALALSLVAYISSTACQPPEVQLVLRFPSEETFLASQNARLDVYDGTENPDAICRALSAGQPPAAGALITSSGVRDACALAEGGTTFSSVDVGRIVVFAETQSSEAQAILRGCTVVALDDTTKTVEVQLSTLPTYPDNLQLSCTNKTEKCQERIDCFAAN